MEGGEGRETVTPPHCKQLDTTCTMYGCVSVERIGMRGVYDRDTGKEEGAGGEVR
jgi:hypothetical protein